MSNLKLAGTMIVLAVALLACQPEQTETTAEAMSPEQLLAKYTTFRLDPDLSGLTPAGRQSVLVGVYRLSTGFCQGEEDVEVRVPFSSASGKHSAGRFVCRRPGPAKPDVGRDGRGAERA